MEVTKVEALNIQFHDNEIDTFVGVIKKLLTACNQVGFKKTFTVIERQLIQDIVDYIGEPRVQEHIITELAKE
jgi:ATP-dependent protease HslVU (ClpYQ) ATPase subunit